MNIVLNGEACALPDDLTIADMLRARDLGARRVAVEVNLEIVPKSRHDTHRLCDGDRVEIVQAIGGG